jgi:hypothetical protein
MFMGLWCLTPLSILQLYRGGQFYRRMIQEDPGITTNLSQVVVVLSLFVFCFVLFLL